MAETRIVQTTTTVIITDDSPPAPPPDTSALDSAEAKLRQCYATHASGSIWRHAVNQYLTGDPKKDYQFRR